MALCLSDPTTSVLSTNFATFVTFDSHFNLIILITTHRRALVAERESPRYTIDGRPPVVDVAVVVVVLLEQRPTDLLVGDVVRKALSRETE